MYRPFGWIDYVEKIAGYEDDAPQYGGGAKSDAMYRTKRTVSGGDSMYSPAPQRQATPTPAPAPAPKPAGPDNFQRSVQRPMNTQQQQGMNWFAKGNQSGGMVSSNNNGSAMANPNSAINQARRNAAANGYQTRGAMSNPSSAINKARAAYRPVGAK